MDALIAVIILVSFVVPCVQEFRRAEKERSLPPEKFGNSCHLDENEEEAEMFFLGYVVGQEPDGGEIQM